MKGIRDVEQKMVVFKTMSYCQFLPALLEDFVSEKKRQCGKCGFDRAKDACEIRHPGRWPLGTEFVCFPHRLFAATVTLGSGGRWGACLEDANFSSWQEG